jgi:hypothetical protein
MRAILGYFNSSWKERGDERIRSGGGGDAELGWFIIPCVSITIPHAGQTNSKVGVRIQRDPQRSQVRVDENVDIFRIEAKLGFKEIWEADFSICENVTMRKRCTNQKIHFR